jgi:MoaA/NifB/PqqE/SkfB family radical SAM enzyme
MLCVLPSPFSDLVRKLKTLAAPGSEVGITTNATLLDQSMAARLLDPGLGFLYFSADGASKETHERIRLGADFDVVTKNIRNCARRRTGTASPCRLMMNFVMPSPAPLEPGYSATGRSRSFGNVR